MVVRGVLGKDLKKVKEYSLLGSVTANIKCRSKYAVRERRKVS